MAPRLPERRMLHPICCLRSVPRALGSFSALVVRLSRKRLVAYFAIAFCVSFGFHIEERRTDHKIQGAVNHICTDSNDRLRILVGSQQYLQFKTDYDRVQFLAALSKLQPAKCHQTNK